MDAIDAFFTPDFIIHCENWFVWCIWFVSREVRLTSNSSHSLAVAMMVTMKADSLPQSFPEACKGHPYPVQGKRHAEEDSL